MGGNRDFHLQQKRKEIKGIISQYDMAKKVSYVGSFLFMLFGLFFIIARPLKNLGINESEAIFIGFTFILLSIFLFLLPVLMPRKTLNADLLEIENELEIQNEMTIDKKAEKFFNRHHLELKRYYDENLMQNKILFVVGVVCIFVGFLIIGLTLYLLFNTPEIGDKIVTGSTGAVSAILTNFIAVMYLKMYSETIESLTHFHNRLVNTHHFHYGNYLISKIENDEKREDALMKLALSINKPIEETKNE